MHISKYSSVCETIVPSVRGGRFALEAVFYAVGHEVSDAVLWENKC